MAYAANNLNPPRRRFNDQKANAQRRGIEWLLSFEDWWGIWQESGKWGERGRKVGQYVMSRRGDAGPYSKDNVFIQPKAENTREAWKAGRTPAPPTNRGKGRGWSYLTDCNRYQSMFRGKHLGYFATKEEASAAYRAAVAAYETAAA